MPLAPAYINVTSVDRGIYNYTARLAWYSPPHTDFHSAIANYSVNITFQDQMRSYVVTSPILNSTFQYNTEYLISITAVNCVGSSDVFVTTLLYSECI